MPLLTVNRPCLKNWNIRIYPIVREKNYAVCSKTVVRGREKSTDTNNTLLSKICMSQQPNLLLHFSIENAQSILLKRLEKSNSAFNQKVSNSNHLLMELKNVTNKALRIKRNLQLFLKSSWNKWQQVIETNYILWFKNAHKLAPSMWVMHQT